MQQLAYGDSLQPFASPKFPKFEGAEREGPPSRGGGGGQRSDPPARFRARTPKMETPFVFFFSQRKTMVPIPQWTSSGVSGPTPTRRPNTRRASESDRGRLRRFGSPSAGSHARGGGTARTPAALPAATVRPSAWASRVRAPEEPCRTDRRRSPESPDGPGTRRRGGERATVKPRRSTP